MLPRLLVWSDVAFFFTASDTMVPYCSIRVPVHLLPYPHTTHFLLYLSLCLSLWICTKAPAAALVQGSFFSKFPYRQLA
ncbi:hypothetical protein EDD16DRAFT_1236522 [Pisolithus croceorrhizus]|nr:hypothetical protein EDD16DRAFT_1236522 [Pisolithus croceorrhizus]